MKKKVKLLGISLLLMGLVAVPSIAEEDVEYVDVYANYAGAFDIQQAAWYEPSSGPIYWTWQDGIGNQWYDQDDYENLLVTSDYNWDLYLYDGIGADGHMAGSYGDYTDNQLYVNLFSGSSVPLSNSGSLFATGTPGTTFLDNYLIIETDKSYDPDPGYSTVLTWYGYTTI